MSCTAPVQCGCGAELLPPLLFRGFLKITSGEGFIASRQGNRGSEGKLAACVFYQTMRECWIVVDSPIPFLLQFVIAVYKVRRTIYLAAVTHSQQIAWVQNTACLESQIP